MTQTTPELVALIHQAPDFDRSRAHILIDRLRGDPRPLAAAIADVLVHVLAGEVDPGIALPPLAMACATLDDASATRAMLDAAHFEIDTLRPLPPQLVAISRGRPPQT